jgi:hypothetical protein
VAPVTEQGEVVVGQPLQEGAALGDLFGRHRGRHLRQRLLRRLQALQHGLPVGHRRPHVGQHPFDAGRQCGALAGIDQPVDLYVHPGLARLLRRRAARPDRLQPALAVALDRVHRVDQQMQAQALAVDLHGNRIDQERHVVVDDLHHAVARTPAVLAGRGAEHLHPRRAGLALAPQLPVRQQGTQQVLRVALAQVVDVDLAEVFARERLETGGLGRGAACGGKRQDGVGAFPTLGFYGGCHVVVLLRQAHCRPGRAGPANAVCWPAYARAA